MATTVLGVRPIIRLAYWTGIRRCDSSTKTMASMVSRPIPMTIANTRQPCVWTTWPRPAGKPAAMEVKISRDMPLPTPFSVIRSPNHMTMRHPVVRAMTTSSTVRMEPSRSSGRLHPSRAPVRASEAIVVACSRARARVR